MSSNHGDKLQLILDAAYEIFGSSGFYETKMSDIADKAGIAKGTLYLYFTSKEQLFAAISRRDFDQFIAEVEFGLKQNDSIEQCLHFIAIHHLGYYFDRRKYTKLFFKAPNNDPQMMQALKDFMDRYMLQLANMMEAFGIPDPTLHAKCFAGILDMIKMDILFTKEFTEQDLTKRAEFSANIFMNGCQAHTQQGVTAGAYTQTPLNQE